jgi:hypothetical protein
MNYLFAVLTMSAAWMWLVAHQLVIGWVVAVLLEQMPEPGPTSGGFYRYFYGVVQFIAANWKRTKAALFTPPVPPSSTKPATP